MSLFPCIVAMWRPRCGAIPNVRSHFGHLKFLRLAMLVLHVTEPRKWETTAGRAVLQLVLANLSPNADGETGLDVMFDRTGVALSVVLR